MLKKCAPAAEMEEKLHHHWVTFNGKIYSGLPKGRHGARDPEVEIGHVVGMIRHLGIDPRCAERLIAGLPRKSLGLD